MDLTFTLFKDFIISLNDLFETLSYNFLTSYKLFIENISEDEREKQLDILRAWVYENDKMILEEGKLTTLYYNDIIYINFSTLEPHLSLEDRKNMFRHLLNLRKIIIEKAQIVRPAENPMTTLITDIQEKILPNFDTTKPQNFNSLITQVLAQPAFEEIFNSFAQNIKANNISPESLIKDLLMNKF